MAMEQRDVVGYLQSTDVTYVMRHREDPDDTYTVRISSVDAEGTVFLGEKRDGLACIWKTDLESLASGGDEHYTYKKIVDEKRELVAHTDEANQRAVRTMRKQLLDR